MEKAALTQLTDLWEWMQPGKSGGCANAVLCQRASCFREGPKKHDRRTACSANLRGADVRDHKLVLPANRQSGMYPRSLRLEESRLISRAGCRLRRPRVAQKIPFSPPESNAAYRMLRWQSPSTFDGEPRLLSHHRTGACDIGRIS